MALLAEIVKTWKCCIECPMNYDGLECRLYKKGYREDVNDEFDPYEETPEWCKVETIKFYDGEKDDN